jgi:hypothetical protein
MRDHSLMTGAILALVALGTSTYWLLREPGAKSHGPVDGPAAELSSPAEPASARAELSPGPDLKTVPSPRSDAKPLTLRQVLEERLGDKAAALFEKATRTGLDLEEAVENPDLIPTWDQVSLKFHNVALTGNPEGDVEPLRKMSKTMVGFEFFTSEGPNSAGAIDSSLLALSAKKRVLLEQEIGPYQAELSGLADQMTAVQQAIRKSAWERGDYVAGPILAPDHPFANSRPPSGAWGTISSNTDRWVFELKFDAYPMEATVLIEQARAIQAQRAEAAKAWLTKNK